VVCYRAAIASAGLYGVLALWRRLARTVRGRRQVSRRSTRVPRCPYAGTPAYHNRPL